VPRVEQPLLLKPFFELFKCQLERAPARRLYTPDKDLILAPLTVSRHLPEYNDLLAVLHIKLYIFELVLKAGSADHRLLILE